LGTALIPFLVYQGLAQWGHSKPRPLLERLFRYGLTSFILVLLVYLFLFVNFTHPLPDHWHREVGGFTYTAKAQWYRDQNLGIPDRNLIQDMGNDVEAVYGRATLSMMRCSLIIGWLSLFGLGSFLSWLFLVLYWRFRRVDS
jgi:hypothetical protein